eukprot:UN29252
MALMLNGTELGDKKLKVDNMDEKEAKTLLESKAPKRQLTEYELACQKMREMMKGPSDAQEARDSEVKRTVYVGNLSKHCTPAHLREEFAQVGEVVYIKFSGLGNADFRYAFIEFATEQQARMAFTFHGKVIAGQAIKIGTAHNPIFKDDVNGINYVDNPLWHAKRAAKRLDSRYKSNHHNHKDKRDRTNRRSKSRDRSRRKRRRRRRRSRSRSRDKNKEESKP